MNATILAPLLAGNVLGTEKAFADGFVIAEWKDAGGISEKPRFIAPLHLHRNDDEAWYVLEGRLCVRVGDQVVEARAASGVFVPRGTPHTFWNPGPEPVRYLLVMTTRVHRMIQEIHKMTERTPAALRAVFEKYDSELLG